MSQAKDIPCLFLYINFLDKLSNRVQDDSKRVEFSMRERFRYFKQKQKMPNFSNLTNGLVASQIKICPNYLFNPDPKVYELSSGLVLAKNFVPDELAIRLTECCLFDFPRRDDAKTNVAKIGKDVEKCIKSFQANSTLAKVDLFGLR